jgi:hypothetical protein
MNFAPIPCALLAGALFFTASLARAETGSELASSAPNADEARRFQTRMSAMIGLTQWLVLRGGNVALEYKTGRLAFELSHGQGLDLNQLPSMSLTSDERAAGARVYVPWTTGFGVGFRFTEHLHALVEFKAHRYNVSGRERDVEIDYTTFSIGPSVFYSIYLYKGLFLEPNVRFWPNVASTLANNRATIVDSNGTAYEHKAHDFGLFANVNLGWTI